MRLTKAATDVLKAWEEDPYGDVLEAKIEELDQAVCWWDSLPGIVCLCGSTRFYEAFQEANYRETMAGNIVLSVGFYPHSSEQAHGEEIGITPEQKQELDRLHFRKIELADRVLILNCDGYIGESTRNELNYARKLGKRVEFLEPEESIEDDPDLGFHLESIEEDFVELRYGYPIEPESVDVEYDARFESGNEQAPDYWLPGDILEYGGWE